MKSALHERISPQEALSLILEHSDCLPPVYKKLEESYGHVLREDIFADSDYPRADRVCMDGIAIQWSEKQRAWSVQGQQYAGDPSLKLLSPSAAIEVATGAVRPIGTDTVIRYEDLVRLEGGFQLKEGLSYRRGQNIQAQASDYSLGERLLQSGTLLLTPELTLLAALGQVELKVTPKSRLTVLSNGHELVPATLNPAPHQTRECNNTAFQGCLQAFSYKELYLRHLEDDGEKMREALKEALRCSDVIIMSGGVSRGPKDLVPGVLGSLGLEPIFYEIKQKPGKPFWFGRSPEGCLIFCLPGNPVAALMNLRRYVIPSLLRKEGLEDRLPRVLIEGSVQASPHMEVMLPVQIRIGEDARIWAQVRMTKGSGDFASLRGTQGFITVPPQAAAIAQGDAVSFYAWDQIFYAKDAVWSSLST